MQTPVLPLALLRAVVVLDVVLAAGGTASLRLRPTHLACPPGAHDHRMLLLQVATLLYEFGDWQLRTGQFCSRRHRVFGSGWDVHPKKGRRHRVFGSGWDVDPKQGWRPCPAPWPARVRPWPVHRSPDVDGMAMMGGSERRAWQWAGESGRHGEDSLNMHEENGMQCECSWNVNAIVCENGE